MNAIEKLDNSKIGTAWSIPVDRPTVVTCTNKKCQFVETMPVPGFLGLCTRETLTICFMGFRHGGI
jgi:hypothetical protein